MYKSVAIILFIILSLCLSVNAKTKNNILFEVSSNKIYAYKINKIIVRWYPRIVYDYVRQDLWNIKFPSIKENERLFGPSKEINGKIYFAYSSFILEFDLLKNKFVNRYNILGEITGFSSNNEKLIIKTFNGIRNKVIDKEQILKITPFQLKFISEYTSLTTRNNEYLKKKLEDALLLSEYAEKVYIKSLIENAFSKDILEKMRLEYINATKIDATNPWNYIYIALISKNLGRDNYADVYFQNAIQIPSLAFYDYFQLSILYEYMGKYQLADEAFEKGLYDFFKRGYNPYQLTSLKAIQNYTTILVPTIEKLKKDSPERLIKLIDKIYNISPSKEGNYNISNATYRYLINKGKFVEAKEWQNRANRNKGFFFPSDYSFILADLSLNILIGCIISFVVFFIIFTTRSFILFYEEKKYNENLTWKDIFITRYLASYHIFSLLILYITTLVSLGIFTNKISVISKILDEPYTMNSGNWGNYATIKYFSSEFKGKYKNLFLGIAYHQIKDYENAKFYYKKINNKYSHNNLAIIYIKEKKFDLAKEELLKAIKEDKFMVEARYNLSLIENSKNIEIKDSVLKNMINYSLNKPIISLPDPEIYKNMFYISYNIKDFSPNNIVKIKTFFKDFASEYVEYLNFLYHVFVFFTFYLIYLLLKLIFVKYRSVNTTNPNYFRKLLGYLIPGISYNWYLFGPFILALSIGFAIITLSYYNFVNISEKTNIGIITSFALPDYSLFAPQKSVDIPYSQEIILISTLLFFMIYIFNFMYLIFSPRYVDN
ncbi:MAG: hypothetical protein KatS3mg068_0669 [Candidatus Sericytochromatia bacterium]|nr:MAG: hypothetical protein KatS3mg068_0669 [Candidatus Sericytochromatia bacterium]